MDLKKFQAAAIATPPSAEASPSTGYPTDGDPSGGVPATVPGAAWFYQMLAEMHAILTAAGITPDHANLTQLLTALRSAGVFQTPAQFDISTKAATMEAVQRALGSLSGFTTINANVTLTAAHAGRGCYFSAAAVATLPLANTVLAGTLIHFASFTTGATSAARQGTDTIAASSGSSALTSMELLDGEDLVLESNGNNQWIAIDGSARLRYSGGRLGVNQTYQNVTASRAVGALYTNTTGSPILVQATFSVPSAGTSQMTAIVNSVPALNNYIVYAQTSGPCTFIVPPGASYGVQVSTGPAAVLNTWYELR